MRSKRKGIIKGKDLNLHCSDIADRKETQKERRLVGKLIKEKGNLWLRVWISTKFL